MSTEKHKAIIHDMAAALNARDLKRLDEMVDDHYAPNYILHRPGFSDLAPGPGVMKTYTRQALKSWESSPDARSVIKDMIAEGNKVAFRYTVYLTDAATGKPTSILGFTIVHFSDGKIVEAWETVSPTAESP